MNTTERGIEEYKMPSIEVDGHSWIRLIDHMALVDQQLQKARDEERERIKRNFYEEFSGAGELWFPYENCGADTKAERDEVVDEYWERVVDHSELDQDISK